ncbi:MAG: hypothetical protein ACJ72V_16665 [Nitrososphaeraceae archaeon]
MNEVNKEFIKNNEKINEVNKQHFEDMLRISQQWFNLFRRPFMGQQQQQEQEKEEDKKKS